MRLPARGQQEGLSLPRELMGSSPGCKWGNLHSVNFDIPMS